MNESRPAGALAPSPLTAIVDRLFCSPHSAIYGPYKRLDDGAVLVPELLHRYLVLDMSDRPASLQVFSGIGQIGGQLWEQEVRVLLRISAVGHPSLPRILDGSYDEENDIAFVVTEAAEYSLAAPNALAYLRKQPAECVRHLGLLADALAVLHGQGLIHRNLLPGSIDVAEVDASSEKLRLRLARFEMSALISNLFRLVTSDARRGEAEVRRLFLGQGGRALAYFPPERLAFLFQDQKEDMLETDRSDVFGLGVIAWEWFVEPLPEKMIPIAAEGQECAPPSAAALRDYMSASITRSKLSARLQDLLRGMLDPDPRTRLTSSQVAEEITRQYDALVAPWQATSSLDKPHLVAFMPQESRSTVWKWEWVDRDPAEPEGRLALAQFLEAELRGAVLVHSPDGADPYVYGGEPEGKRRAQYVLLGQRGSWFCTPFEDFDPFGGSKGILDDILLIKYVAKRIGTRPLEAMPFRRVVSSLDVVPWNVTRVALDQRRKGRPSWIPMLEAVRVDAPKPAWQTNFERAYEWFLEQQEVELLARRYPFERSPETGAANRVRIRIDRDRDRRHVHGRRTALFSLFASNSSRRPSFGDFFDGLESENEDARAVLQFCSEDDRGNPDWERSSDAFMYQRLDDEQIEIRRASGSLPVPEKGWLRPKADIGAEIALKRQRGARPEFLESKSLLGQLHAPMAIKGFRHRWREAGKGLRGGAQDVVKDMLVSQAFYALHGPPGTGKTTVAAHAIDAYLASERGARILVSAQSNRALDNLALRIRKQLIRRGLEFLAIRVTSQSSTDKVDPRLNDWRLENLATRLVQKIISQCTERLERRTDPEALRPIVGQWKAAVEMNHLELQDRIRRGANLVFATCSAATKSNIDAVGSFGVYDWVLVEEAAKAWPTEIAIPLVRGVRWTLIGDHKQLPAHRRNEVEALLRECAQSEDENLRLHGESRAAYGKIFDLFGSLFSEDRSIPDSSRRTRSGLATPIGRLNLQFRMRRSIAEVVSRAFYPEPGPRNSDVLPKGTLESAPENEVDSGLRAPRELVDRALVWIDTEDVEHCGDEPRWCNPGEARIIANLLRQMKPRVWSEKHAPDDEPLAILTPYRDQIDLIAGSSLPDGCASRIFSVHEFQGREADIVLVSLVRDRVRGAAPINNLGHLAQPELVNVLLSRARRLLVIVGRFDHFYESDLEFWRVACETVRQEGHVLRADNTATFDIGGR